MKVRYKLIIVILTKEIKRKITMEIVNNSRIWRKFWIMRVKRRKYFIKPIIYINNRTFDYFPLSWSK